MPSGTDLWYNLSNNSAASYTKMDNNFLNFGDIIFVGRFISLKDSSTTQQICRYQYIKTVGPQTYFTFFFGSWL